MASWVTQYDKLMRSEDLESRVQSALLERLQTSASGELVDSAIAVIRAGGAIATLLATPKVADSMLAHHYREFEQVWGEERGESALDYFDVALITVLSFTSLAQLGEIKDPKDPRSSTEWRAAHQRVAAAMSDRDGKTVRALLALARQLAALHTPLGRSVLRAVLRELSELEIAGVLRVDQLMRRDAAYWIYCFQFALHEPDPILEPETPPPSPHHQDESLPKSATRPVTAFDPSMLDWLRKDRVSPGTEGRRDPSIGVPSSPPGYKPKPRPAPAPAPAPAPKPKPDPKDPPGETYRVWFGTDRAPEVSADHSRGFSNSRDPREQLHLGHCDVFVPKAHQFGKVRDGWFERWTHFGKSEGDLRVLGITGSSSAKQFSKQLAKALKAGLADARTVTVYIHGYNSSFEGAAIRAAQIGFDLKVPGAMAFYSWPSAGGSLDYIVDEASVETSEPRFVEFIRLLVDDTGATRVHIIAHSMGNRLLARTASTLKDAGVKLGKMILAAPDVDADLFRRLAKSYPSLADGTTMYISSRDRALDLSRALHKFGRAGFTPPVTIVPGIDTVEVTAIDLSLLGHGYFAEAGPVLNDMKAYLEGQNDPRRRLRLAEEQTPDGAFWRFSP